MPVKLSQSGTRVLTVLEKIAEYQPVGMSELARLVESDNSAMQRTLATLAEAGWIRAAPGGRALWELSSRIHAVAQLAQGGHTLRRRAHAILEALRDETGETSSLNLLERGRFIVADVLESRKYVRVVVPEGLIVPARGSATGRAILAFMSRERQLEFLDGKPDAEELKEYAATRKRGYALSSDIVYTGFTNIAAPVFEAEGRPIAALVVAVPSDRSSQKECAKLGNSVVAAARKLSRGLERPGADLTATVQRRKAK